MGCASQYVHVINDDEYIRLLEHMSHHLMSYVTSSYEYIRLLEHRKKVGLEDRVFFSIDEELLYFPFCADFGPLNIGCKSIICV